MRLYIKSVCVLFLVAMTSVVLADPSYVQALPSDDSASQSSAINQTNQSGSDAFGQQIVSDQGNQNNMIGSTSNQAKSAQKQPVATSAMDASAQDTLLQSRVMQVNQDFLDYQSKTNQQISQLQDANQKLSQQISTLASQIAMMQASMSNTQSTNAANQASANSIGGFEQEIGAVPFYIIIGIFALLIIIIILLLIPRKKAKSQEEPVVDMKSDYDYLSTKEAIPAKLDLARSYIVMEDFDSAKEVLAEVLTTGDDKQKALANNLLKECEQPKKTDA